MLFEIIIGMVLFGIITIVLGYVSGFILGRFEHTKIPVICADWNKNHIMEKSLFITGALSWLFSYTFSKIYI